MEKQVEIKHVQNYAGSEDYVHNLLADRDYDSRVKHFINAVRLLNLPNTTKALALVLDRMVAEKGYQRYDGQDYYIHPIAVAQTAIDFGIINKLIIEGDLVKADEVLTVALLHDAIEDIPDITKAKLTDDFSQAIAEAVDNVSKRKDELFVDYLKRVSSNDVSALVKILDRLDNLSTLSGATLQHRKQQYLETKKLYLPLTIAYRHMYWSYGDFFWQARTIMQSLLAEIKRSNEAEERLYGLLDARVNKKAD